MDISIKLPGAVLSLLMLKTRRCNVHLLKNKPQDPDMANACHPTGFWPTQPCHRTGLIKLDRQRPISYNNFGFSLQFVFPLLTFSFKPLTCSWLIFANFFISIGMLPCPTPSTRRGFFPNLLFFTLFLFLFCIAKA